MQACLPPACAPACCCAGRCTHADRCRARHRQAFVLAAFVVQNLSQNTAARDISQFPQDPRVTTKVYPCGTPRTCLPAGRGATQVLRKLVISRRVATVLSYRGVTASEPWYSTAVSLPRLPAGRQAWRFGKTDGNADWRHFEIGSRPTGLKPWYLRGPAYRKPV